ncbi:MAG TPA: DNA mismatch endonuclease Vsr [Ktedonobacterales bacterium]
MSKAPSKTTSKTPAKRSAEEISAIMRKVHGRDTTPEMALRRALWARGLRYRVNATDLPGKPDIVITSARLAIFADGDFWHGNQFRKRKLTALEEQFPETATKTYWLTKIRRNMTRDAAHTSVLLSQEWSVLRFWESQLRADLEGCVAMVARVVEEGTASVASALASRLPQRTVAEFFAGIGLMRLGLERQGWRVTFANDIDTRKEAMYAAHFQDTQPHFVLGDVHTLAAKDIPDVTLATASFPCTDLSLAGARGGIHVRESSAFWGFTHALEELGERRPPLVLLENVTGFLTSHRGADFRLAMQELNRLGYSVDAFILDAARFVPQSRQRLFVIGVQDALYEEGTAPLPVPLVSDVRPRALAEYMLAHQDAIRWCVRPLPPMPTSSETLADILEDLPPDHPMWWSAERAMYLLNQMSPAHRAVADQMIAGEDWSYGTVFRRMRAGRSMAELRTDGVAGCLRTPKGGSAKQILFKAGRGEYHARLMTPHEAARLMGAGDYMISTSLDSAYFGFGDAVCVPVIEWIATHYLNPLVNELIRGKPLRSLSNGGPK